MKFYDVENKSLIYINKKRIDKDFWDIFWLKNRNNLRSHVLKFNPKSLVCRITRKFLHPKEGIILEGGCGLGFNVYSLKKMNYNTIGIDNAHNTIEKIKKLIPEINVEYGDVQNIPFHDNYFIGYWSLGVIEHFLKGYNEVAKEMYRVIKPKGFLFLSFPYMSPFRKFKAYAHIFKYLTKNYYQSHKISENFYQYALSEHEVIRNFEKLGFCLKYREPHGGIYGFKNEVFFLKFFLIKFFLLLYQTNKPEFLRKIKRFIDKILTKFSAHLILLVFQKTD